MINLSFPLFHVVIIGIEDCLILGFCCCSTRSTTVGSATMTPTKLKTLQKAIEAVASSVELVEAYLRVIIERAKNGAQKSQAQVKRPQETIGTTTKFSPGRNGRKCLYCLLSRLVEPTIMALDKANYIGRLQKNDDLTFGSIKTKADE